MAEASVASLPYTGSATSVLRIKHPIEIEAIPAPTEVYEQYVAPPAPAPARMAARVSAPAGYVTISVPIYKQTRALNCETGALQMGLAAYGRYYSQDALFAYELEVIDGELVVPDVKGLGLELVETGTWEEVAKA